MCNQRPQNNSFNNIGTIMLFLGGLSVLGYYANDMGLETFYERYWWVIILLGVSIFMLIIVGIIYFAKKQAPQQTQYHTVEKKEKEATMLDEDDPFAKYDK